MELEKIRYSELNSKQKEIYNFQKVSSRLADYGFNCIKLADDWQGADFLAYHKDGIETLKVQLKSRVFVDDKYARKNIYMAFPIDNSWCLIEHDELLDLVSKNTVWLQSQAWAKTKAYSSGSINKRLKLALQNHVI